MGHYLKMLKMRVISMEEGTLVGKILDFVVDYDSYTIKGFIVNGKWNKDADVLPYQDVLSVGDDVVMIKNSKSVVKASKNAALMKLIDNRVDIRKIEVITQNGHVLGKVDDFEFKSDTGKIEVFEIQSSRALERFKNFFEGKNHVTTSRIISVGKDAIVIKEDKKTAGSKEDPKNKEAKKKTSKKKSSGKKSAKKKTSKKKSSGKKSAKKKTSKKKSSKKKTAKKKTSKKKSSKKKTSGK